jgi:hypothetical protein
MVFTFCISGTKGARKLGRKYIGSQLIRHIKKPIKKPEKKPKK